MKIWGLIFSILVGLLPAVCPAAQALTSEQNTYSRYVKAGMEQLKNGGYEAARESFEEALRYYDIDSAAHLGLGIAYFHLRDDRYAERELNRSIELNPRDGTAYQVLGELYYRKDDLETAVSFWEKAVELNPSDTQSKARLDRIKKEHSTEKDFNRDVTSHFLTKYEGRERIEAGRIVLRILEEAYGDVGRSLSFYPDREIQVILYTGQQFQEVTDAPGWSGGIYDGKIRIPVGGISEETPGLRKLLFHEYTHAVVRSITRQCPTWLNEGLAQYFEARDIDGYQKGILKQLAQSGKIPALSNLEGSFANLGAKQAMYAYLLSLSSVQYAVNEFGMYRVKTMLESLAGGAGTGKAMNDAFLVTYEEFEREWKRSLESFR